MDDARPDLRFGISVTRYALTVRLEGPFMARYIRSHPQYQDLVAS